MGVPAAMLPLLSSSGRASCVADPTWTSFGCENVSVRKKWQGLVAKTYHGALSQRLHVGLALGASSAYLALDVSSALLDRDAGRMGIESSACLAPDASGTAPRPDRRPVGPTSGARPLPDTSGSALGPDRGWVGPTSSACPAPSTTGTVLGLDASGTPLGPDRGRVGPTSGACPAPSTTGAVLGLDASGTPLSPATGCVRLVRGASLTLDARDVWLGLEMGCAGLALGVVVRSGVSGIRCGLGLLKKTKSTKKRKELTISSSEAETISSSGVGTTSLSTAWRRPDLGRWRFRRAAV